MASRRPSKEQFYEDYWISKLSLKEMMKKYGVSDVSICNWRKHYGIEARGEVFPDHAVPFTDRQIAIINGLLVGDGYMAISGHAIHPQLSVEHSTLQEDYLLWLHQELSPHSQKITYRTIQPREVDGHEISGTAYACRFRTACHPALVPIYAEHYPNGKRVVNREILDRFTELSLAVWFMDDGSHSRKSLNISIREYPLENLNQIITWFRERWGLECRMAWAGSCYKIEFTVSQSARLAEIIWPHVVPSMRYKLDI